jgi:processive 1,2-diacylglycerol beta-glucosyltransferase
MTPKPVLILTACYGEGHNAAARNLKAAFEESSGVEAEVVDLFTTAYGEAYARSCRAYVDVVNRFPALWSAMYRLLDRTALIHLLAARLGRLERALAAELARRRPAAVISTYPLYPFLLRRAERAGGRRHEFGEFTVVTDSLTINSVWHRSGSDLFFVPNVGTAQVMQRAGVPGSKLRVLGFPVPLRFAAARPHRSPAGAGEMPKILFMINAASHRALGFAAFLMQISGIHLTITAGRDEALRDRLEAMAREARGPCEIHGWTPDMPRLLMSHHVLIGKAGGATVQEAITAQTPMLITQVIPGQEEGNVQLLLENDCAAVSKTPEAVVSWIERLFIGDAALWRRWERNIARLSRPDAAREIAAAVLSEIQRREAAGVPMLSAGSRDCGQ